MAPGNSVAPWPAGGAAAVAAGAAAGLATEAAARLTELVTSPVGIWMVAMVSGLTDEVPPLSARGCGEVGSAGAVVRPAAGVRSGFGGTGGTIDRLVGAVAVIDAGAG